LHMMTKEIDSGDIVLQDQSLEIRDSDTYGWLFDRQVEMVEQLIVKFFEDPLKHLARKRSQEGSRVTYAPRLSFPIGQHDTVQEIRARFLGDSNDELSASSNKGW
jgi:methionyl-tRNA formyltransferase